MKAWAKNETIKRSLLSSSVNIIISLVFFFIMKCNDEPEPVCIYVYTSIQLFDIWCSEYITVAYGLDNTRGHGCAAQRSITGSAHSSILAGRWTRYSRQLTTVNGSPGERIQESLPLGAHIYVHICMYMNVYVYTFVCLYNSVVSSNTPVCTGVLDF